MAKGEYFTFKNLTDIRQRVKDLNLSDDLGFSDDISPAKPGRKISSPINCGPFVLSNRFAIHPMEGWDADPVSGAPTLDTLRRWERMGQSGASLLWGVEAMAVDFEYRANPNQLVINESTALALEQGLKLIRQAHSRCFGTASRIVIGAQITCSGRYSHGRLKGSPLLLMYHHPELDKRVHADKDTLLMTDQKIESIVGQYAAASRVAKKIGFDFIDIKACHRYWLNETLAAKTRPGQYGGSSDNRTKIFLMIVDAIRREVGPDFTLGSRLNACDGIPFEEDPATQRPGLKGYGHPSPFTTPYVWGWGVNESDPLQPDLSEPIQLIAKLKAKGLKLFNISSGSPYSNPHFSRPTETPPVDGYQPHHDPLHEVALHFSVAASIKKAHPDIVVIGTAYSYLRQFKAHAAEYNIEKGRVDMVGLGRALLSYHDEARKLLETGEAKIEKGRMVCTGDSACTTGPRFGLKSGCIFDPYYVQVNQAIKSRLTEIGLTKK